MNKKFVDSGVDWLGEIPYLWSVQRLKSILLERNEKNDPVKTDRILSLMRERGVIPYEEKGDVGNKSKEKLSEYKLAYPGDIVLNSMNVIIGSVGLSEYFGAVSPVYYMLRPRKENDSVKYFNYIFQTKIFQTKLVGYGNGILAHRMRIQMSKLNTIKLPYPPNRIQHNIVDFLDERVLQIDFIIERTKQSIEELKKYKQSLITETVTKGLDPNVEMKDSETAYIGDIPFNWNVSRIRYLGFLQNGISKSGEYFGSGHPFVSYSDVYKNIELPKNVDGLVESTCEERERYSVKKGDVFFTRTSETIQEVGFASTCMEEIPDAVFAGFVIRFRPETQELNPAYAKYYFRSEIHRKFFVKEMNIVTRASLSQGLLKRLPVLLPSQVEQREISQFLDEKCYHIDNLIEKKQKIIAEMESYKKSLIYEYVTGKKEVV